MKKKSFTYGLIAVLIMIWGGVFFRVKSGFNNEVDYKASEVIIHLPESDVNVDTFNLLLDYDDPFGMPVPKKKKKVVSKPKVVRKVQPKKEVKKHNWPHVQFNGIIENKITGKQSFMVRFNGNEMILSKGDSIEDYVLLSGNGQAIELKFGNEKKLFEKE
jgi:hypothetical protein